MDLSFLENATLVWVKINKHVWVYNKTKKVVRHDPADRCGGPFGITSLVGAEEGGERLYLFSVVESHFPLVDLVVANSLEEAYEKYVDWAAVNRHLQISEEDIKDYKEDDLQFTSDGIPVDTVNVSGGGECRLISAEFEEGIDYSTIEVRDK